MFNVVLEKEKFVIDALAVVLIVEDIMSKSITEPFSISASRFVPLEFDA